MIARTSGCLRLPLVLATLALPAGADAQSPVGFIRAGTLTVSGISSRPVATMAGGAVDVNATLDDGAFEARGCFPCAEGAAVGVGGRISGGGRGRVFYEVDFAISGPALQIPAGAPSELLLTGSFKLQGFVIPASRRNAPFEEKEPPVELEGDGIVTLSFTSGFDPGTGKRLYFFRQATYKFSPSAE
jgi:hypothetical protein